MAEHELVDMAGRRVAIRGEQDYLLPYKDRTGVVRKCLWFDGINHKEGDRVGEPIQFVFINIDEPSSPQYDKVVVTDSMCELLEE